MIRRPPSPSARWRIVAWMLLVMALALTVVVVMVRGLLLTSVANRANHDVSQEIGEFRTFADVGVDPETGRAFTSTARMLEVYLSGQQPGSAELLLGLLPLQGAVLEQRGNLVPAPDIYDPLTDPVLMQHMEQASTGVHTSAAGTIRWGRIDIEVNGRVEGTHLVLNFTQSEDEEAEQATRILILVALGALLVTVALSFMAAGQILRPLRLLQQTAEEVSDRDLTARIPVCGNDDLARLARTFNSMLDRLESAFDAQQQFVDDAGHELRTPITAIRGHLELLPLKTPAGQAETITLLTSELDRMSRIVNDLLALAKADQPDFVQPDATDIGELTLDLDALGQALADRKWTLTHIADGMAVVDRQRVTQAVLQLLANAVQHSVRGDTIRLSSEFVDAEGVPSVQFTVADTGPGVRPEDRDPIFQRFARIQDKGGSTHAGAGLGLAIVNAIAIAHRGSVAVGGEYGEGAIFTLTLPVGDVPQPVADDLIGEEKVKVG